MALIVHNFTAADTFFGNNMAQLYRITPLEKKSVEFVIETYQLEEGEFLRGFTATFVYRWGQGFREMDNEVWQFEVKQGVNCDPQLGWGCELDDLISVYVEFDGEFTEEEQEEIRAYCEGELEDEEGRYGEAWIFDGDHNWQIEMDEVIIHSPIKIDIIDEDQYNVVIEENIQPKD